MFARIALALALTCALCARSSADITLSVINVSPDATATGTTYTQPAEQVDSDFGTLSFSMETIPAVTDADGFFTTDIFTYVDYAAQIDNPEDGGIINAFVSDYDLSIGIVDADLGNLGTIDLVGSGNGGTFADVATAGNPASRTFINDFVSVFKVNGQDVILDVDSTGMFAVPFGANQFLNIRFFDPNPGFQEGNFTPGLAVEVFLTDVEPAFDFQLITADPTEQRQRQADPIGTPEPASVAVFACATLAAGFVRRRRAKASA